MRFGTEAIGGFAIEIEFGDSEFSAKPARVAERGDQSERQDHRAGPGGDVIEIEIKPLGEEDDFGWDGRAGVVTDLAQGGEVEFCEAVALFRAAGFEDDLAGGAHVRRIGIVAEEF